MGAAVQSAPQSPQLPADRLGGLDALRGIAALCVLHFHVMGIYASDPGLMGKGYLAVDFFFMLSGYVMARTYERRLGEGYGAWRFIAARYRRLWPVMALGTLFGAPLLALEYNDLGASLSVILPNLLLLPAVTRNILFPVNSAAWSILAELSVNLLHGLLLWRLRRVQLVLLYLLAVPAVAWVGLHFGSLNFGAATGNAYAGLARAVLSYTGGIVLWRCWRDRPGLRIHPLLAFALLPALLLLVPMLGAESWWYDLAVVLLASPLLIAGGLAYRGSHWFWRWLGLISFPLYAVNLPLLHWSKILGIGALAGIACVLAMATYIALRTSPAPRPARSLAEA